MIDELVYQLGQVDVLILELHAESPTHGMDHLAEYLQGSVKTIDLEGHEDFLANVNGGLGSDEYTALADVVDVA